MLAPPWSIFKKSFTKCKFDKIDIIQYVLYIIRAIHCRYENGTLISIAILFRFLNNQPISQKNYVYMIIIPFYILSLVKIYIISNFFQVCIIRFFLQKQTKEGGAFMKQRIPFLRSIFQKTIYRNMVVVHASFMYFIEFTSSYLLGECCCQRDTTSFLFSSIFSQQLPKVQSLVQ